MYRLANVATRLELNSGKSSVMSTELTQLAPTRDLVSLISSLRGSTCTITKLMVVNMFPELFWLTWSLAPWTVLGLVPLELSSGQTTSSLDSLELETIGPRGTTLRVLNFDSVLDVVRKEAE